MAEKIGFIGLGNMGQPMATRLIEAGNTLTVYDVAKARVDELVKKGAKAAGSPKEAAAQATVVVSMIPDGSILKTVYLGNDGALAGAKSGTILIDMSTVDPSSSAEVAKAAEAKGLKMLRAPVSGSTVLAAQGKLTVFASGDKAAYEKVLPIFNVLGQKVFNVGTADEARYIKLVLNMMVGTTCQMLAESLAFGEKAGINWNTMLEVIGASVVASPLVAYKIPPLVKRDFKAAFTAGMMAKDFDIALEAGGKIGVPMPVTAVTRQCLGALKATGRGDLDFSALLLLMEELSGIKK